MLSRINFWIAFLFTGNQKFAAATYRLVSASGCSFRGAAELPKISTQKKRTIFTFLY